MEKSTTASSTEIANQRQKVADLSNELARNESQYDKNNQIINKYKTQLNLSQAEVNKLTSELNKNEEQLDDNKNSYTKLTETISDQKSKLADLKTQYGSVVLEQGKNSKEAQSLAKEIKSLSNNIKDNETKLESSTKAIDEFTDAEKDAGSETLKLGDLIKANLTSEVIIAGVKGLASAMCWSRVLNSFSAHSITAFWQDGPVYKGLCLASLTAGSDNNQPFRILAFIASSGTPKSLLHIPYSFILSTCFYAIAEVICTSHLFSLLLYPK